MSQTKLFLAKWGWATLVALLMLVPLVLVACGEPTSAPPEPAATEVSVEPPAATSAPTEPPTPTDVPTEPPPTDTPVPTEEPTPVVLDDSACIACHTSEETLKAMAVEEEVAESLSEGEG